MDTTYDVRDSTEQGGPTFNWQEISGGGTSINISNFDDGCAGPIALPFEFPFFGERFNQIYVNSNGMLNFVNSSRAYKNRAIPSPSSSTPGVGFPDPDNFIAPLWADLDSICPGGGDGSLFYQAVPGAVVFEWVTWALFPCPQGGSVSVTMQAILFTDGAVVFQYLNVSGNFPGSVGLENQDGTFGWAYGGNTFNSSLTGRAVRFAPVN